MDIYNLYKSKNSIEKLYEKWTKQGLSEEQKKVRLNLYLDEQKRKYNS